MPAYPKSLRIVPLKADEASASRLNRRGNFPIRAQGGQDAAPKNAGLPLMLSASPHHQSGHRHFILGLSVGFGLS